MTWFRLFSKRNVTMSRQSSVDVARSSSITHELPASGGSWFASRFTPICADLENKFAYVATGCGSSGSIRNR